MLDAKIIRIPSSQTGAVDFSIYFSASLPLGETSSRHQDIANICPNRWQDTVGLGRARIDFWSSLLPAGIHIEGCTFSFLNCSKSSKIYPVMPKWTFLVVVTGIICSESHAFQPGAVHLAPGSPWPRCQLKSTVSAPSATVVAAQGHPQSDESRSKISVANKGKTPWNKGGKHSPETRAKIAATSARNARKKLEAKAAAMGMTLDEWNASIEEERQKRKSEPRTVSDETRAKISLALKARWNNPEYREANKNKVRANLNNTGGVRSHSPETRKRISESLKKKWAEDPEYREKVINTAISVETRKKISASLRERWRDPEFRATMTERVRGNMPDEHRRKISEAIKVRKVVECSGACLIAKELLEAQHLLIFCACACFKFVSKSGWTQFIGRVQ